MQLGSFSSQKLVLIQIYHDAVETWVAFLLRKMHRWQNKANQLKTQCLKKVDLGRFHFQAFNSKNDPKFFETIVKMNSALLQIMSS